MSDQHLFENVSDEDAKKFDELTEQICQLIYNEAQLKPEFKPQVNREVKAMLAKYWPKLKKAMES